MTFEFFSVPRIVMGPGERSKVSQIVRTFGRRVLVVHNGPVEELERIGWGENLERTLFRQRGEPRVRDIDQALAQGRDAQCDCVVGVGGGSAIDCAKAVAGLLTNGGVASDYMEVVGKGLKITRPAMPWIAVPTTAGTGAEVTRNAVVGWPEKKFKASIRSEHLLARAVVIDPELQVNVPADVTARSGMDALCQCIEAYTSKGAQAMTDALAIRGVALGARALPRAHADGGDLEAREEMALAALLSGVALTNAGLGAVHGFAAPLGANFPVPHGTVCGVLLPHVIAANVREGAREDARETARAGDEKLKRKYGDVGRAMTGDRALSDEAAIERCITMTCELVRDLGLGPLGDFGVRHEHVAEMVGLAKKSSSMRYNPVVLSDEVLAEVLGAGI